VTVFGFGSRLNPESWAESVGRLVSNGPTGSRNRTVRIDLSRLGFADYVAVGRLLNLIGTLARTGLSIVVRLPADTMSPDQHDEPSRELRRSRQRANCRLFLQQCGFQRVLTTGPFRDSIRFVDATSGEDSQEYASPASRDEDSRVPHRRRKIVPYSWWDLWALDGGRAKNLSSLTDSLKAVGVSGEDAETISRGIVAELIAHFDTLRPPPGAADGNTAILIGAAVVSSDVYNTRIDDFSPPIREFVQHEAQARRTLVRVLVAISGRPLWSNPGESERHDLGDVASDQLRAMVGLAQLRRNDISNVAMYRGSRGLWRVRQFISGYEGSLFVTVGDTACVDVPGASDSGRARGFAADPALPGAVIECTIPVGRVAPPVSGAGAVSTTDDVWLPSEALRVGHSALTCVSVMIHPTRGLESPSGSRLQELISGSANPDDTDGVAVVVHRPSGCSPTCDEIKDCLSEVRGAAEASEGAANLAVVFPSINRRMVAVAVRDLNLERELEQPSGEPLSRLILVVSSRNQFWWLGGTSAERQILKALVRSHRSLDVSEVGSFRIAEATKLSSIRRLRERTTLIRAHGGELILQLRPEDVVAAVAGDLAQRLRQAIESPDSHAVDRGVFLTPSLRVATRWCDVGTLLADVGAEELTGFVLASRIAALVGRSDGGAPPPSLFATGRVPDEFVRTLAIASTGSDDYYDSASSFSLDRTAGSGDARLRLVLVTDVVSSGNSITKAVADLESRGVDVLAVVGVVDGRPNKPAEARDILAVGGSGLPLVCATEVDLEAGTPMIADGEVVDGKLVPIDPVLLRPEQSVLTAPQALIEQSVYISALVRTNSARLGHIDRPAGRHYTAYVDPTMLFNDDAWAHKVTNRIRTKVRDANVAAFGKAGSTAPVCIVYPDRTDDALPSVAAAIGGVLSKAGVPVQGILPIPRTALDKQWLFGSSAPLPPNCGHVVVLDSSAESGRSVQQLIRVSAVAPIRAVTTILLLNGLRDFDAVALQGTTSVKRYSGGGGRSDKALDIPVNLHFVARTAVTSLDSRECPICEDRKMYAAIPLLAPIPAHLERHRSWLLRSLEPRSKDRVFEEHPTDLLGAHIGQEDCVEYLRWRFEIREAAFDTLRRAAVVRKLDEASGDRRQRDSLIRLLASERNWLESPPLHFPSVRRTIADLACSLLIGSEPAFVDPVLRVQAIMVLVNAEPGEFARSFLRIAADNRDSELIPTHTLLEALRFVIAPPAPGALLGTHTPQVISRLIALENELQDRPDTGTSTDADGDGFDLTLPDIRYVISHGRRTLQPVPTDPQSAWAALSGYRQSIKAHVDNAMWRLLADLGFLERRRLLHNPARLVADWRSCSETLALDVFPNVKFLRHVLTSPRVVRRLTPDDRQRWEQVINGDGLRELDQTTARIQRLVAGLEAGGDSVDFSVEQLDADLRWWNRFFLATHAEPSVSNAGAFLVEIVRRCPADLRAAIAEAFVDDECEIEIADPGFRASIPVFCDGVLLANALTHIRRNAVETYRATAEEAPVFHIKIDGLDRDELVVVIRNTASAPSTRGAGNGLRSLGSDLHDFGGRIEPVPDVPLPWTYGVSLTLQRWRMM
jgi:hypothetical protein